MITLVNYEVFSANGLIPQELIGLVRIGDGLSLWFNDSEFSGTVTYISIIMNEENQAAFSVKYSDPLFSVPLGSRVRIKIVKQFSDNVVIIPEIALLKGAEGKYYVQIRKNNGEEVVSQPVTIGLCSNGMVEIVSGLDEGQKVLIDIAKMDTTSD